MQQDKVAQLVAHLFRHQAGKMIAALVRLFGFEHVNLAEDVVQDTFITAYQQWHFAALPEQPEAWLMTVARNKAINAVKRGARIKNFDPSLFLGEEADATGRYIDAAFAEKEITDSQLQLLFLCCHPQLPEKSQLILTLQVLCGFSLDEIANALFMQKEAVKKALYRAKEDIREKGLHTHTNFILFSEQRTTLVLQVLYLMFNEGYKTTSDAELINTDLCYEAIRLCKLLLQIKDNTEADALMALMFFCIARFPSRQDEQGAIVLLEDQDRSLWKQEFIREGFCYLELSRRSDRLSRYHLEAGIAAAHCTAPSYNETDWQKIIFYYDQLLLLQYSPVICIHKAFAIAAAHGPEAGLQLLGQVKDAALDQYYLYHAGKGSLLYKIGAYADARACFEAALIHTRSSANQSFLSKQIQNCLQAENKL